MDQYDANQPVGTGPFKIVEWNRGTGVVLEAHDGYWEEGLPKAARVNWNFYPEEDSRVLALQAGEIDVVNSVPEQQIPQLQESGEIIVEPIPGVVHDYIAFNCAEGPFSDVRMRKAVAHAIDKEIIVEGALWGYGQATNIPFPETSPWYVETPVYEYDPEKAKALIEEAGFGDGLDIDMPVPGFSPLPTVAELVQADLAAVGINLRLVQTEWATYWPEIYLKTQFDITVMEYSARVDPDQTFHPRYHSEGVHNATKYANERMDELLDAGRSETDTDRRKEIYDEVQTILVDELPWLWLFLPDVTMGWRSNVTGFRQHPGSHFYVTETTKDGE
jgi:peptide/nickel transport system substrate-binding protein